VPVCCIESYINLLGTYAELGRWLRTKKSWKESAI